VGFLLLFYDLTIWQHCGFNVVAGYQKGTTDDGLGRKVRKGEGGRGSFKAACGCVLGKHFRWNFQMFFWQLHSIFIG